uniref:Uncharacterized protein n=2 Tax=Anopheles funestus TaxID=62324 RepID=A0A182S0J4_ANOFN
MMVQHIGDEFVRSQHTISIKAGLARQMLPLRKLNVPNMEWSVCGSFERGETSIGLILDYCNNQNQGTWAGLHCEFMNRNGTM